MCIFAESFAAGRTSVAVTTALFPLLGVAPARGRTLLPEEEWAGRDRVTILSHDFWQRRFGGDSAIVGSTVRINGEGHEVIGVVADVRHVTPEGSAGLQVYFPMAQMWDFGTMDLVVRSRLPAPAIASAVSAALAEIDPQMPTHNYWTLEQTLGTFWTRNRARAMAAWATRRASS